jgi:hypothetical protein
MEECEKAEIQRETGKAPTEAGKQDLFDCGRRRDRFDSRNEDGMMLNRRRGIDDISNKNKAVFCCEYEEGTTDSNIFKRKWEIDELKESPRSFFIFETNMRKG